ncbi:MAG: biopolymer transporter ExbD [Acidobacteriota bacterium]|nr:biopolymer transporter ExbD [Acidobacteriota bacterium]
MTFSRGSRRQAEITLTPLIDILFIVLLFLVLTATFTEQTVLRVALPRAATGEPVVEDVSVLRVLIDADGQVYLDDRIRTLDEVRTRLDAMADPDRARVIIAADRAASHGSVVQVLDLVRQAGIVRVEIQTFAAAQRNPPL